MFLGWRTVPKEGWAFTRKDSPLTHPSRRKVEGGTTRGLGCAPPPPSSGLLVVWIARSVSVPRAIIGVPVRSPHTRTMAAVRLLALAAAMGVGCLARLCFTLLFPSRGYLVPPCASFTLRYPRCNALHCLGSFLPPPNAFAPFPPAAAFALCDSSRCQDAPEALPAL